MMKNMDAYFKAVIDEGCYGSEKNLKFYLETVFYGIDFNKKNVLDIGGGDGLLSFFAAVSGAESVLCLEPEGDGSSQNMNNKFNKLLKKLDCINVKLQTKTFQEFDPEDKKFDIIIMHDSINHLDESACITLKTDERSWDIYKKLVKRLHSMVNPNGDILLCDCSRYNFFAQFKLKNPLAPTIEWYKHQSPETWVQLFKEAGFGDEKIRWLSFNTFGKSGKFFLANKVAAYFLHSYFCVKMKKV